MFECSKEGILGKHWVEKISYDYLQKVLENQIEIKKGNKVRYEAEVNFGGKQLNVLVSVSPFYDGSLYQGNLKVIVDITERKKVEEKLRHNALKYNVRPGGSYLIPERVLKTGIKVMNDLLNSGYNGLLISRTPPEKIPEGIRNNVRILGLSGMKNGRDSLPPNLIILRKSIEDFISRDRVVLIDRLDYLIVQNGFLKVLKFINELTDVMYVSKSILLIVIDPETLAKNELSLLEKEIQRIKDKSEVKLGQDLLEILDFIWKENNASRMPVYKDIIKSCRISQPTATKKLKELKSKGLINERKMGRFKALELSENGKELF